MSYDLEVVKCRYVVCRKLDQSLYVQRQQPSHFEETSKHVQIQHKKDVHHMEVSSHREVPIPYAPFSNTTNFSTH